MSSFYSLTKRQFLAITGFNKFSCGNIKEKKSFYCIFSVIAVTFLVLSLCWFKISIHICMGLQSSQRILNEVLKPLITVSTFISFLSALMKGSGILYLDKSISLLFSYPVKTGTIVLSKLSIVYLWNICISIALLSIPLFRYEGLQKGSGIYCIIDFLQIWILPVIPTLLGVILGNIIYRRCKILFQSNSYTKGSTYLGLFIIFLAFMIFFFEHIDFSTLYKVGIAKIDFFNGIVFSHDYRSILFSAGSISAGVLLTVYVIHTYKRICEKMQMYFTNRKNIRANYKKHTKLRALFHREWKRYVSSPVYLLNTMLGNVSLILFTIYSCLETECVIEYLKVIGMIFEIENIYILPAFAVGLLILLSNVTYACISIEGPHRELLKSYPATVNEILIAKYLFQLSLTVPIIFVCAFLLGTTFRMNASEYSLLFILPVVFSAFAGALGLLMNLIFPKYDWENVTYIVKQSLSAILTILLSIGSVGGALWIMIQFFSTQIVRASYILAFLFILLTVFIGMLLREASKTF